MALKFAVNNSLSAITSLPSGISGGALNLISTQTASASASLEFSLDDSYDSYVFKFIDINPATDNVDFTFNGSTDGGSNYNITKTTTFFNAYHDEADTGTALTYQGGNDQAQSTAFTIIATAVGNGADESVSGTTQLFNPSSSVFVKHFISNVTKNSYNDYCINDYSAGYFNTTSAIDAVQFKMSSGNFDGIIKMYGVA